MKPPMPIKPRGERGNRWLRYVVAAMMLAVVVGGSAFAVTRFFGDDDNPGAPAQTTDLGTQEPEVAVAEPSPTENATQPTQPAEETAPVATEEPDEEAEPTEDTAEAQQAEPTEAVAAASSGEEEESTTSGDAGSLLLPTAADLDGAWVVTAEGERTKSEVGAQLGDNGEDLLTGWRWSENLFRDFNRDGQASDEETFFLSVSVHRFANQEGAEEALDYFSDVVISGQGLQEVPDVSIGDSARGLQGAEEGANLYVLYVREGNTMVRLGGSSLIGDPAPFVNAVAEFIIGE